jgi:acyl-CoA dehydrogenase
MHKACAVDRCPQLFGGYGYITEFPIARLYADARVPGSTAAPAR